MSDKDFENTIYEFVITLKPKGDIVDDPALPGAIGFLSGLKQEYVFQKAPIGIERYDTGITTGSRPFKWEIKDGWLIIIQELEGKQIDQSFYLGMGINELITSDESFRYYLTKVK